MKLWINLYSNWPMRMIFSEKRRGLFILGLFLWVFTVGCVGSAGTTVTLDTLSGQKGIEKNDFLFGRRIEVIDVIYRDVGGIMEAQITFKNRSKASTFIELKGKWFDQAGYEISDPKELWREVIFSGKEEKTIMLVAPNKEAVKVQIMTRRGSPVGP
ncbi:MAG: YcfL family protein [Nitrospinae bacterium]|nr:YcfL family protein [Nitrospinota bacterium]